MVAATLLLAGVIAHAPLVSGRVDLAAPAARDAAPSPVASNDGPTAPSEPVHQIGIGATMGLGTRSSGAGLRYFFNDRVGLNANVSWYQPTPLAGSHSGRLLVAPSAVFMLTKSRKNAVVDVRPYIGGGLNYATGGTPIGVAGTTDSTRTGGLGMQAFGGVEFTFQDARAFSISGEVVHYEIAGAAFANSLGEGTNVYVLLHYYMR